MSNILILPKSDACNGKNHKVITLLGFLSLVVATMVSSRKRTSFSSSSYEFNSKIASRYQFVQKLNSKCTSHLEAHRVSCLQNANNATIKE